MHVTVALFDLSHCSIVTSITFRDMQLVLDDYTDQAVWSVDCHYGQENEESKWRRRRNAAARCNKVICSDCSSSFLFGTFDTARHGTAPTRMLEMTTDVITLVCSDYCLRITISIVRILIA